MINYIIHFTFSKRNFRQKSFIWIRETTDQIQNSNSLIFDALYHEMQTCCFFLKFLVAAMRHANVCAVIFENTVYLRTLDLNGPRNSLFVKNWAIKLPSEWIKPMSFQPMGFSLLILMTTAILYQKTIGQHGLIWPKSNFFTPRCFSALLCEAVSVYYSAPVSVFDTTTDLAKWRLFSSPDQWHGCQSQGHGL